MSHEEALHALRAQQNFALAVPAGLAAALAGAVIWAFFTYLTGMALGLIAIVIGALVGFAIRKVGRGVDMHFSALGALCSALGWALGTVLCDVAFLAKAAHRSFFEVLTILGTSDLASLVMQAADAMDFLFLAIAVWEGWKLSRAYSL